MLRYVWALLAITACASGGHGGGGDDDGDDTDGGSANGDDGGGGGGNGGAGTAWLVLPEDSNPRLSIEPGGDLYVGGTFRGTIEVGGTTLTSAGETDIFVARFAPDGHARWARRFGGAGAEHLADLDGGATGVAVTGDFWRTVDFGGGNLTSTNAAGWEFRDLFVLRLDGDGAHRWSADTTGHGSGRGVEIDDTSDRVIAVGELNGIADAGTGNLCLADYDCGVVTMYQPGGAPLWTRSLRPATIAVGGVYTHAVFATGGRAILLGMAPAADVTAGPFERYPATWPVTGTNSGEDVVLTSFVAATGEHQWSRRYGGGYGDTPAGLAVDGDQLLLAMSVPLSPAMVVQQMPPLGDTDFVLARIGLDGNGAWSRRYGGFDVTAATALYVDLSGRRLLAGRFTERATFGATTLEAQGAGDAFVLDVADAPISEPAIVVAPTGTGREVIEDLLMLGDRLIVAGRVSEATNVMEVDVPAKSSFVIAGSP